MSPPIPVIDEPSLPHTPALIPRGVADYFWEQARGRRQLEGALLETFRAWGYGDVIPPMFEYADTLNARANSGLQSEMYRFLDRDGSTLALRADMTISVARLVGARLHDYPMPQRFCYAGSVFRYTEPQAGRQREFSQAGVELIGAGGPEADAEVLALAVKALRVAGLDRFQLVIGQMQYYHGILEDLHLSVGQEAALHRALDRNSAAELAEFLRDTPLRTQQRRTLEELPTLSGEHAVAVIDRADRLCLNYTMHAALENLRALCDLLAAYDVARCIHLDLTEIHNLGYYTGMVFEALAPEMGFAIASGGRYDDLVATFGHAQPAVGAAFGLDRLLLAQRAHSGESYETKPRAPHLLVATNNSPRCLAIVEEWRSQGVSVAVEVTGRAGEELWRAACQLGITRALTWICDGFDVYQDAKQPGVPSCFLAADGAYGAVEFLLSQP